MKITIFGGHFEKMQIFGIRRPMSIVSLDRSFNMTLR